jgi:sterol 3beta-glucosyltransferase
MVKAVKIYLVTLGSRGDNEPFRALATEAAHAGHEVFFAHTSDTPTVQGADYEELALPGSFEAIIAQQGVSIIKALRSYRSVLKPMLEGVYQESTRQIIEIKPDVVVYHPKVLTAATAAHHVGALAVIAEMFPTLTPTREFAAAGLIATLPGWLNKASYGLITLALHGFGNPSGALRRELGVVNSQPDLSLCPVSPSLVPQPADWPEHAVVTGNWRLPKKEHHDPELEEFLAAGPVLYAGFGSMMDGHGARRSRVVVAAARSLGLKTLLVTGWGGLEATQEFIDAPDVLVRASVNHAQILPNITVALHHGGAGTTHAMLHSGVPSVVMPFLADQPWWAHRLHKQGLGPRALPKGLRSPARLRRALVAAMECAPAAGQVARSMALEDGVGKALEILEAAEAGQHPLAEV